MANPCLFRSDLVRDSLAPLVLRLALASIFILHGYSKIQYDWGASWMATFSRHLTLPEPVCIAVAWGEFIGGIALLIGFHTRLAALGIAVIMSGAIVILSQQVGFVMVDIGPERSTRMSIVGYEYNVAILAICFALLVFGSGKLSVDYLLGCCCAGSKKSCANGPAREQISA